MDCNTEVCVDFSWTFSCIETNNECAVGTTGDHLAAYTAVNGYLYVNSGLKSSCYDDLVSGVVGQIGDAGVSVAACQTMWPRNSDVVQMDCYRFNAISTALHEVNVKAQTYTC